jgi:hypothetical protein
MRKLDPESGEGIKLRYRQALRAKFRVQDQEPVEEDPTILKAPHEEESNAIDEIPLKNLKAGI